MSIPLSGKDLAKIRKKIKDFYIKSTLDFNDLYSYDSTVFEKIRNKELYTLVLNMNLFEYPPESKFYGGLDIDIFESVDKTHYIYHLISWGGLVMLSFIIAPFGCILNVEHHIRAPDVESAIRAFGLRHPAGPYELLLETANGKQHIGYYTFEKSIVREGI